MPPESEAEQEHAAANESGQDDALVRFQSILLVGFVIAATLALYIPNLGDSFVDWDLVAYRGVLGSTSYLETSLRLFADFEGRVVAGYYAPLGSVSLMMDKVLIGSDVPAPSATLLINLLLHCLNGALVYVLMRRLTAERAVAILTAAIFLIHPIQVSSVVWFAQRKGVLSTALYLGAFLAYLRFVDCRAWTHYAVTLVLFLAALLTKPIVAVFPVALVATQVISYWSRCDGLAFGSTDRGSRAEVFLTEDGSDCPSEARRRLWRDLAWIVPFFGLAFIFGLVVMESERVSMVTPTRDIPLIERPVIAATAVWFYVSKVLIPVDFSPVYGRWEVDISAPAWWLPLLALGAAAILVLRYRHEIGALGLWCVVSLLIPLATSTTIFKFGYLRLSFVADHFFYLSMVGAAGGLALVIQRVRMLCRGWLTGVATVGLALYLGVIAVQTWSYAGTWQNSLALWGYNLRQNPGNPIACNYLGHALMVDGRPNEAAECFLRTVTLKQLYVDEHAVRAWALEWTGDQSGAREELAKAADVRGTLAIAYHNLGNAFLTGGRPTEAKPAYERAIELQPGLVRAITNLGVAHIGIGNFSEAVKHLQRAIELSPHNFEAHYNLGYALHVLGKKDLAEKHFHAARTLRPDFPGPALPDEPSSGPATR